MASLRIAVALFACATALSAASDAHEEASYLAHLAAKAEQSGETARAYVLYSQAYALDPTNLAWAVRIQSLGGAIAQDPNLRKEADKLKKEPKPEAPADYSIFGTVTKEQAAEALQPLPPTELQAGAGTRDFNLRGDARTLYEQVAKEYRLLVVFDSDFKPADQLHFQLDQADYRTALRVLQAATDSFITPVGDRLIFVASDTTAKRTEFERTVSVAIPIPETETPQELQEVATAVRATMDIRQLLVDTANRIFLVRDRVSKVRPAEALVESLMHPHAQVEIGVKLLTTDDSRSTTWGLSLPSSFPLVDFGHIGSSVASSSIPSGIMSFLSFGGGATFLGIGITNTQLFAEATKSITTNVFDANLVASDGQPATMTAGSKYPLVTSTFIATVPGGSLPPPTIQFEDLGLTLKITPHVHGTDEVTLDVEAQYELLGAQTANGVPTLDNRKYQSSVRLLTGQEAVITGLLTKTEARSLSGIAGLASVPIIGKMLSQNTNSTDRSDTLIVITPRLVSLPPDNNSPALLTGTETRPLSLL